MIMRIFLLAYLGLQIFILIKIADRPAKDVKRIYSILQAVNAAVSFVVSGIWSAIGALFFLLIVHICPSGLVKILWIVSLVFSVLTTVGAMFAA